MTGYCFSGDHINCPDSADDTGECSCPCHLIGDAIDAAIPTRPQEASMDIQTLIKNAMRSDEDEAVSSITGDPLPDIDIIDMGFLKVGYKRDADRQQFVDYLKSLLRGGAFGTPTLDAIAAGQSYITWGGWVGDQRDALLLMALGQHHGAWTVATPETLGIANDSEQGKTLMGGGFIYTTNLTPEFHALLEA